MKLLNYNINDVEVEADSGTPQNKKLIQNSKTLLYLFSKLQKKKKSTQQSLSKISI